MTKYYNTEEKQKSVLAIHDISCIGRCSLTVALPILSACGINTGILPSAILSTHTGEFTDYVVYDQTENMLPIANHLKEVALPIDVIYTGYLAGPEQIYVIEEIFKKFENSLKYVDPAFADNYKLYPMMTNEMVEKFRILVSKADIIKPNITEALFLLGMDVKKYDMDVKKAFDICKKLSDMGPAKIILSGIEMDGEIYTFLYDKTTNEISETKNEKYNGNFHGTGDCFASCILGCLLNDIDIKKSLEISTEFICRCIEKTILSNDPYKYGVRFEQVIPWLINKIKDAKN